MTAATMSAGAHDAERSTPAREPHSWRRRHKFATFVVTLITLTLFVRLVWGWYAARQLANELDEIRRRGEPASLAEFQLEPLHASENAWTVYLQAINALAPGVDSPRQSQLEYPPSPPHGPKWEELAAASEKANAAAFAAARRARSLTRAQTQFIDFAGTRHLVNVLADGAQYAHLRGDDAEAVERLLDGLHLARSVRQDPTFGSQLIGIGAEAIALDAAQQIVPSLNLSAARGNPASPTQARVLIVAILDEGQTRACVAAAFRRERVVMLDALGQESAGTWAIRPLADRTAVRLLREFEPLIDLHRQDHAEPARELYRGAKAKASAAPKFSILPGPGDYENRVIPRYSRWFEWDGSPFDLARLWEQFHRAPAERRATAVIVAARLYRHDHGRWPETAAALVPNYLDALPADPFREDAAPIGYVLLRGTLPDGSDRPMVYFDFGEGGEELIDPEPMYSWQQDWRRKPGTPHREIRQYRDVSFWTAKTRRFDEQQKRLMEQQEQFQSEQKQMEEDRQRMLKRLYGLQEAVEGNEEEPDAPRDGANDDEGADRPPEQ